MVLFLLDSFSMFRLLDLTTIIIAIFLKKYNIMWKKIIFPFYLHIFSIKSI